MKQSPFSFVSGSHNEIDLVVIFGRGEKPIKGTQISIIDKSHRGGTTFRGGEPREEEKSPFGSARRGAKEERKKEKKKTPPLLSPIKSRHMAFKNRVFAPLIKGHIFV